MLKRIFSIVLILAITIPNLVIPIYLRSEIKQTKREIKHKIIAGIDRTELVQLTFTAEQESELVWEHSKEFEYKGEMYDVVEKETSNGITTYWCWWDHEETSLNKQLKFLVAKTLREEGTNGKTESIQTILEWNIYSIAGFSFELSAAKENSSTKIFAVESHWDSLLAEIIPPPPRKA